MVSQRCSMRSRIGWLGWLPILLLANAGAWAQTGPKLVHEGFNCVVAGQHLKLTTRIEPIEGLATVKAYFRADIYPQFYYVEMVRNGDVYEGLLPKPSDGIQGIHYYLEAMDESFNSDRTDEFTPQVVSDEQECERDNPVPPAYANPAGTIPVGSTTGPLLPPGFGPESLVAIPRIVGTGGGGLGAGAIGAIAAGAGAAVVGVVVSDGSGSTTTVPVMTSSVPGPTTTVGGGMQTTSTIPSSMIDACFETTPMPPRIPVGGTVRFDATCSEPRGGIASYQWDLSDGRTDRTGRVVNRRYGQPGTFPASLLITTQSGQTDTTEMDVIVDPGTTTSGPTPPGGSTTTVPGSADLSLTMGGPGSVGVGVNAAYNISFANGGPDFDPSVAITLTFNPSGTGTVSFVSGGPGCSPSGSAPLIVACNIGGLAPGPGAPFSVTVHYNSADTYFVSANITGGTTDPAPGNNGGNVTTVASQRAPDGAPGRITTRLTSALELPPGDGTTQARITFNQRRGAITDNSGPSTHDVPGRRGQNLVDGHVLGVPTSQGLWRFDFRGAPGFVPGSFNVEVGNVVSRRPDEIVFRVAPGARRVRFRFRLSEQ